MIKGRAVWVQVSRGSFVCIITLFNDCFRNTKTRFFNTLLQLLYTISRHGGRLDCSRAEQRCVRATERRSDACMRVRAMVGCFASLSRLSCLASLTSALERRRRPHEWKTPSSMSWNDRLCRRRRPPILLRDEFTTRFVDDVSA